VADGPALALQRGIVARLKADATLAALVGGRVYDEPPEPPTFPYVRLGTFVAEPFRTDARQAWTVTFGVECHSRPNAGRVEATRMVDAVIGALEQSQTVLTVTGFTVAWVDLVTSQVARDQDGQTYSGIVAFEAVLDVPV
jgi:hypothetical protein